MDDRAASTDRLRRQGLSPPRRAGADGVGRSVALAHSLEWNFARIAAIYEEIAEGSPPRWL